MEKERKFSSPQPSRASLHAPVSVTPQQSVGEPTIGEVNPTLDDAVKILSNLKDYQYADGILSFLRTHPLIRWDKSGNMMSPIHDVNIIDIIRYWVNRNAVFDPDKISDLRMMVKLVDVPDSSIKNTRARNLLYKGGKVRPRKTII